MTKWLSGRIVFAIEKGNRIFCLSDVLELCEKLKLNKLLSWKLFYLPVSGKKLLTSQNNPPRLLRRYDLIVGKENVATVQTKVMEIKYRKIKRLLQILWMFLMTIQLKYNKIMEFIPFTKYYSDYNFNLTVDKTQMVSNIWNSNFLTSIQHWRKTIFAYDTEKYLYVQAYWYNMIFLQHMYKIDYHIYLVSYTVLFQEKLHCYLL